MTRRHMLEFCGGAAAAGIGAGSGVAAAKPERIKLGVCTYSFNAFQRRLAISMIRQLKVKYVSVKDFHISYYADAGEIARAKAAFQKAGLTIVSGGAIPLQDQDAAALRKYFEYARACGMPMIVVAPTHKTLDTVEKLAGEFDIQVAIHNHGPEDEHFPTPKSVLDAVKGRTRGWGCAWISVIR